MKIFSYAREHPEEILAVTDDGERIPYGAMNALAQTLGTVVGHRLVFALCRNTPGALLGYLGLLQSGGVPLLLDADIAPALLKDLVRTYRPAFCLVPEDLPKESLEAFGEGLSWNRPRGTSHAHEAGGAGGSMHVSGPDSGSAGETCKDARSEAVLEDARQEALRIRDDSIPTPESPHQFTEALRIRDYRLLRCAPEGTDPELAPELRLLLATSGSTGSQKLVRISAGNLDANAASIIEYLRITKEDRPVTVLPMQYSYGMSILHTHVMAGAAILLTRYTLLEKRFWDRVREEGATSLCGVPFTFEIYRRVGLMQMDLPALRTITQAGGKLPEKRHLQFAEWAAKRGIRFYVMYGQTEASPRMAWLPPEKAVEKCGSMGIAIPGGRLELADENGAVLPPETGRSTREENGSIDGRDGQGIVSLGEKPREKASPEKGYGDAVGELVYTGKNVALGYALCAEDLGKGDEFHGVLHTGDLARRDADGFFYIVGRRSRFIKIAGKRIGLDEAEKILRAQFPDVDLACAGKDEELQIFAAAAEEPGMADRLCGCAQTMIGIPLRRCRILFLREIPRTSAGKIRYAELSELSEKEQSFS